MEEIKIFHSFKKSALLLLASAVFTGAAVFFLIQERPIGIHLLGIVLLIVLFGGGGLFLCFWFLSERLTGKAYLVISDKSLKINTFKEREVPFIDVESFNVEGDMICINYKKGKRPNPKVIQIGNKFIDPGDSFLSVRLTQKPEEICAELNKRVKAVSDFK